MNAVGRSITNGTPLRLIASSMYHFTRKISTGASWVTPRKRRRPAGGRRCCARPRKILVRGEVDARRTRRALAHVVVGRRDDLVDAATRLGELLESRRSTAAVSASGKRSASAFSLRASTRTFVPAVRSLRAMTSELTSGARNEYRDSLIQPPPIVFSKRRRLAPALSTVNPFSARSLHIELAAVHLA